MKSERGNVVVYLLVGLVLFGLLVTAVWWVKAKSTPVATPVVTQNTAKPQTETETKIAQDEKPASEQKPAESQPKPNPTTNRPAPTTPQSPAPAKPESQTPRIGTTGPSTVASSGPLEDAVASSLLIGGATFAAASYLRSRRSL